MTACMTSSQFWDTDTARETPYVDRSPATIAAIKQALAGVVASSVRVTPHITAKQTPPIPPPRDLALEGWVMIDNSDEADDFVIMAPTPPPRL